MSKINVLEHKTLKLQNVLMYRVDFSNELSMTFDAEIDKMVTLIHTHGLQTIGPLVVFSSAIVDVAKAEINMQLMLQTDSFMHNVEPPYHMDSLVRIKNCLYAHYVGPEDKLKLN